MRATRTTVNLKNTSIHEHMLNDQDNTKSKMSNIPEKSMSDIKHSVSISAHTTHHIEDTLINNENCQIFENPSNDCHNSSFSVNNNRQELSSIPLPTNQYLMDQPVYISTFSGDKGEDAGQWLDQIFASIETKELTPNEQRDLAAERLRGGALLWYRLNRLEIPDMKSFVDQFLLAYNSPRPMASDTNTKSKDIHGTNILLEETAEERESKQVHINTSKSIMEGNYYNEPVARPTSPVRVLQSARNEKVKLFPNFSGSENSLNWLKNLQQIGKTLKLNDQQLYELATIKLSGPAQEWFYHQNEEIDNWSSFKQFFFHAFPPPIQPTNIDYLAQLLARKQGEAEPVGKFVQDINRLCLKLDTKISEQDQLQYLRRGLRPQLQHYALAITSLQDFLTIMQRHEQIK